MANLILKNKPTENPVELSPAELRLLMIRRAGVNLTRLGLRLGCGQPVLSNVLAGRSRSRRLERALARAVGLSVEAFFPEHYGSSKGAA